MQVIKVSEATSQQINWLVAKCEGVAVTKFRESPSLFFGGGFDKYAPSTNWEQGGPIIEREKIELIPPKDEDDHEWMAVWYKCDDAEAGIQVGKSLLIAAMRCFVSSKLGDTAEVPEELCK